MEDEDMKKKDVEKSPETNSEERSFEAAPTAEAVQAEEPLPVRWVSDNEFARSVARQMGRAISEYIPRVAVPMSPYTFAAKHVFFMFLSLPLVLAGPILAVLFSPLFLALLAVPPILFVAPWLRLKMMIGDREREASGELPFFAIHAALCQSAGLNLYESLRSTIAEGLLNQVERSARFVRRNVQVLDMSPMKAIERLGRKHPQEDMQRFLLGYTSEWRSGGDLSNYLEDKAEQHLRLTIHKWENYRGDVGTVVEIAVTTLFILPIMVLMATFLSPDLATTLGVGFIAVGIPIILALGYAMIRSTQPRDYTTYTGNHVLPFILAPLAFFVSWTQTGAWVSISIAAGVGLVCYAIPVIIEMRHARAHEGSLSQFLRDVTEYRKLNYPIPRAIRALCMEGNYSSQFNSLLERVSSQLESGVRLSKVRVPTRSWLTRLSFFYLGQISRSGGSTTRSMELLSNFVSRIKDARDEVRSGTSLYRYIALATPLGLALITGIMTGMFQLFAMPEFAGVSGGAGAIGGAGFMNMFKMPASFAVIAKATILSSSVGLSFLASYAADFTPKNLSWTALAAFLAAGAMQLLPLISDWFTSFMGFG